MIGIKKAALKIRHHARVMLGCEPAVEQVWWHFESKALQYTAAVLVSALLSFLALAFPSGIMLAILCGLSVFTSVVVGMIRR